jgi:hypothetical protein
MKYKSLLIEAFEREPGKWSAKITRAHGGPLGSRIRKFVTSAEHSSATEAMMNAMEVIDAGFFSRNTQRIKEKYWRRLSKPDPKLEAVTTGRIESLGER